MQNVQSNPNPLVKVYFYVRVYTYPLIIDIGTGCVHVYCTETCIYMYKNILLCYLKSNFIIRCIDEYIKPKPTTLVTTIELTIF